MKFVFNNLPSRASRPPHRWETDPTNTAHELEQRMSPPPFQSFQHFHNSANVMPKVDETSARGLVGRTYLEAAIGSRRRRKSIVFL